MRLGTRQAFCLAALSTGSSYSQGLPCLADDIPCLLPPSYLVKCSTVFSPLRHPARPCVGCSFCVIPSSSSCPGSGPLQVLLALYVDPQLIDTMQSYDRVHPHSLRAFGRRTLSSLYSVPSTIADTSASVVVAKPKWNGGQPCLNSTFWF